MPAPKGQFIVNDRLAKLMDEMSDTQQLKVQGIIMYYVKEIRKRMQIDPIETVRATMELIDEEGLNGITKSSCKKGCHFCCSMNVDITEEEADIIIDYCKKEKVTIDREYLTQQLNYSAAEIYLSPVGKCGFLKDGLCSIYEVRPIACRKYHVATPPDDCDFSKGIKQTGIISSLHVEIIHSAFMNVVKDHIALRLPSQILKQLKK